jgi:hypothetical protein
MLLGGFLNAQQSVSLPSTGVPRLVNFSGRAADAQGKTITGVAGATFAIYKDQAGGAPLWMETQSVQADLKGNYSVQLGATKPEGLPLDLFASSEARWLGVTINGGEEQPRILLLSVPYALKAADAETVGGLPASAFVLANKSQENAAATQTGGSSNPAKNTAPPPANPAVTGKGVAGFLPVWDSASDIVDSVVSQKSSLIGINTSAPAATLDVNGKGDVRDTLTLFPKGTDPTLAISGTTFKVDQTGKVTFVTGQNFPHTVSHVIAGNDLTGGGGGETVRLNLDTTKVPQLNSVNTFTGNQGVIGSVTVTGSVGVGTASPATSLDIFSGTGAVHAPIARFGSNGGNDCNSILTYTGSGNAEIFEAGVAGCFMPGAVTGDGGLRVSPGNRILLGDNNAYRVLIDDVGNVEQQRAASGMVKAMLHFSSFNNGRIISCFNSTFSGAAATTPPCGFSFDCPYSGDCIFDFGFEVDDRIYSATPGTQTGLDKSALPIMVEACGNQDGQCVHTGTLTNNQVEVTAYSYAGDSVDSKIHLIVY